MKSRYSEMIARRDRAAITRTAREKSWRGQMNVWLRREDPHSSTFQNFGWL